MATPSESPTADQVQANLRALLNGPAVEPPAGVTPNFVHPPNFEATIIPTMALGLTITTLAVLVRLYSKMFLLRSIAYEDYIIVLAWIGHAGLLVPSILVYKNGGGVHTWNVRLKDFIDLLYWLNIGGILYGIIICLIKESILLQYMRIFVPNRKGDMILYVTIQLIMWTVAIFYPVDTGFMIGMCNPREKIWNLLMTTGHCFNVNAAGEATGVFNVISDFAILIVPIFPIRKLQMPFKRKMMMIAIFATGFCACVASIVRTHYAFKVAESADASYNLVRLGICSWGEITSGLLVACLPIMPKFFQHVSSKVHGALSSISKSRFKVEKNSASSIIENRLEISDKPKQPFNKYKAGLSISDTWSNAGAQQDSRKGDYITLDEFEMVTLGVKVDRQRRATLREDLEAGH